VEGLPDDRLGERARLVASRPKTTIRVLWSSMGSRPVVLRLPHLADVLPGCTEPWGMLARARRLPAPNSSAPRASRKTAVRSFWKTCCTGVQLDLGEADERAPHRNAELVAADAGETGGEQLFAQPLTLAAEGAVTVQDQRPVLSPPTSR
jgi:hypothetical protein